MRLCGYHWLADGSGIERAGHPEVREWLTLAVVTTGLTPIAPPLIRSGMAGGRYWAMGYQMVAESHVSVEIRGSGGYVDIFSCKTLDPEACMAITRSIFGGVWKPVEGESIRQGLLLRHGPD